MSAQNYLRRRYRVLAKDQEALSAWLWEQGTLGIQELGSPELRVGDDPELWAERVPEPDSEILLEAYFPVEAEGPGEPPAELRASLEGDHLQAEEDWLATHREIARPLLIGRRLMVDPRELDSEPRVVPEGRTLLRIPARTAFGTGSHESTRLVLELMEDLALDGRRVLDVGAGSGILAMAALSFGARSAVGVEIDPAAVLMAGQYARTNRLRPLLTAGGLEILAPRPAFSLALVNILPERMLPWIHRLPPLLEDGAVALFSGILEVAA
ncbi:MAG: 50S ribosomal protein L11 methyltransferase, partial [Acidobacteriota bacterium]|nr:50S ribosomal protein L11 methyltransferase [Acidobacteriota bacterium]